MEFEDYVGAVMSAGGSYWLLREYLGDGKYFWGYCTPEGVLFPAERERPSTSPTKRWTASLKDLQRCYRQRAEDFGPPMDPVIRKIRLMSKRQRFKFQECV